MGKKYILLYTTVIFFFFTFTFPVFAAENTPNPEEYNQQVKEEVALLEEKYQIRISYPVREDGYSGIGTGTLATLDSSLSYLSETFVRQMSLYYYNLNGKRLTIEYTYLSQDLEKRDPTALGFFSSKNSLIQLFLPTRGEGMVVSGSSPFAILHEFGHAYYVYLGDKVGISSIKQEWFPLNYPYKYGAHLENPDRNIFMTHYSSMAFEEDFAETFAYAFGCNRDGLGIGYRLQDSENQPTGLGKKVKYISYSIKENIINYEIALDNIEKSKDANPVKKYRHLKLSGNSLEYIYFSQPAGIVDNVLSSLKIEASSVEWYWQIGGWKVRDNIGGEYLVFPGSAFVTLRIPAS